MSGRHDEWGPWTEHDGTVCPVPVGTFVQVDVGIHSIVGYGRFCEFRVCRVSEKWRGWPYVQRYRIRKPRGLIILEGILEALDTPLPSEVPA